MLNNMQKNMTDMQNNMTDVQNMQQKSICRICQTYMQNKYAKYAK